MTIVEKEAMEAIKPMEEFCRKYGLKDISVSIFAQDAGIPDTAVITSDNGFHMRIRGGEKWE